MNASRNKEQAEVRKAVGIWIRVSTEDQYRPLEERRKALEEEIPRLQGEVDFLKIEYLSSGQVISEARDLYSRWPELNFEEKRKIVENIVEKILIGKDEVQIDLCYLPSSFKEVTEKPGFA